jgi:hypothetical protein
VLGVEPASFKHGLAPSEPVRAALPRVVSLARETIAQWSGAGEAAEVGALVAA